MEVEQEITTVTSKKKSDKNESPTEGPSTKHEGKKTEKKADGDDPKPRIVLTFRSEKAGAKTSTMKIVPTEEKHEEISPRRSSRRAAKWDLSDDEGEPIVSPRKDKSHHTSENDEASDSSHTALKRSTRRRSKEFDNVIANAIARKEKSYNETPVPTRPSRRIKPTAKVLANEELRIGLESQNIVRLGTQTEKSPEEGVRTRRSVRGRQPVQEEPVQVKEVNEENEEEGDSQNQVMKLKHLCELGLKAIKPEDINDEDEELTEEEAIELDDDSAEDEEIDDDSEVISKLLEADAESISDSDDEFLCSGENVPGSKTRRTTRSTRQHSSFKNDSARSSVHEDDDQSAPLRRSSRKRHLRAISVSPTAEVIGYEVHKKKLRSTATPDDDGEEIGSEAAGGDEGSEAACPPDDSAIVATCFCETASNVYAAPSELTEPVFCQAIELVDGVRVGCSHGARKAEGGSHAALVRAGPRAPYFLACTLHAMQLGKHMCCPACGLFCSQGYFYQCSEGHLFHLECGLPYNSSAATGCPHCGVHSYRWLPANNACVKVKVDMRTTNKRIFLPEQREQCTPAYFGFTTLKASQFDQGPVIPEDLLPSTPIDLKRLCEKPDMEDDPTDAAEALCDAILAGEDVDSLIPKIISGAGLDTPLAAARGGAALHAAARRGHLAAVHLLHTAGADLDSTAGSKTPLMVAVLALLDKSETKSPKKSKTTIELVKQEGATVKETEDGKESEEDKDDTKSELEMRADDDELMKVIRYLIAAGCDVNLPGPDGMTALHMAAQHGGSEVCGVILNNSAACVDARDQGGWTPLVWAAENLHADTVRLLLANGANASAADNEGNSVIHWCALAGATRPLQLLLDSAPDAVNAANAHTDTPLHVAARAGHYACVIMLLARGARTDVENSAGELPAHVCEQQARCHAAISLNMQMSLALSDKLTRRRLLTSDISRGREELPIPCVNEVDSAPLPADFVYITAHVTPAAVAVDRTIRSAQGCRCGEDCSLGSCECSVLAVRRWWARGRLLPAFPFHDPPMLFECNQTCACNAKKCTNSVITRLCNKGSVFIRAAVFRVGGARGWGLRAQSRVARGTPVATYVGELLTVEDADSRSADQYMFALDVKPDLLEQCTDKTQLCVDAAVYGGAARFINHSCRPNLAPVRVFTSARDLRLPIVALFAARDIPAGHELTFDYGDKFWSVKSKWMRCECGAPDCRYPTKVEDAET